MCGPFSFGDFTYATNGHILVRVPRRSDVPEWEALNEKTAVLFDEIDYTAANAALTEIPDFPQPEPVACKICKGSGKVSKCPECDGEGEVTVSNDWHDYECECLTCHGEGKVHGTDATCFACDGTGMKKVMKRVAMGCTGFSSHYLTMMKELPGMKISPTSEIGPNYFKWGEGDGLLMPMRVESA
jgi:hypothetical protein